MSVRDRLNFIYRDTEQREFARELRNQPTLAEKRLWLFLRAEQLGVKFRPQTAIGVYIVDFVCFSHKLIVEFDGPQHLDSKAVEYDLRRTEWLRSQGFHVIRFRNQTLDENIWEVVGRIREELNKRPLPSPPQKVGREQ